MRTLEGRCVQDADRLDALPAGWHCPLLCLPAGRLACCTTRPSHRHACLGRADKSAKGTSLNHFHEKLFLLKDRMNTESGRQLALERHRFMEEFVARFLREWEGG